MSSRENQVIIKEIIEIARTLNNPIPKEKPLDIITISNAERILHYAFDEVYGEDEYTWSDIRQLETSELRRKLYEITTPSKLEGLEDLTEYIADHLRKSIPEQYSDFFEVIVVDLKNCAINRIVTGKISNFYEIILHIYKSGGLPCGWQGNYPDEGKIIAYYN
ncbi:hypothetical protein [Paenibacillus hunanensis]|uniref:Cytoplasmic protein n=1 Tax=Paenibacillus hunanensis TaxID=539262 RepID=A0ABU1J1Z9_9BACL|nr:hypothetical protein [Paenibacillus hunanensis]MCL9660368.1 hypothetical protein [Paenibacillus hunanensis]MDR6245537.1 hypothetical protein [Paenibacillus hunanensis]GGJ09787.1 hypothetical protein GCM10008022_18650 [Paenibacillus hunanensis]